MKLFSSFRAKLILTIFPVVAGVTTGALVLAEWKFRETYQRLFEEQFESQITAATQAKNRRFNALSSVLETMAKNPALVNAMRNRDYAQATRELRPPLETLATERLQNERANLGLAVLDRRLHEPPPEDGMAGFGPGLEPDFPMEPGQRPGRGEPPRAPFSGGPNAFTAVISPEGEIILNPRNRSPESSRALADLSGNGGSTGVLVDSSSGFRRSQASNLWLQGRQIGDVLKQQEVAYLVVETGIHRSEQVREVFLTPVNDTENGGFLGAFVFGLPLPAIADRILNEQTRRNEYGEIIGGIFAENRLVSSSIPAQARERVEAALRVALASGQDSGRQDLHLTPGDETHRLIYRVLNPGSPFSQAVQVNLYSLAAMHQEITELRHSVISLAAVALLASLGLVLFISRGLSGPIHAMVEATDQIEQGNFDVRVPAGKKDEIGQLALAFNEMAAGLALQEKYRSVLNAVADRTVAQRLIENREALGGELKEVTVLFCDIRGFTSLTENMPPHEVIDLLNEHMTILTEVAYQHGGIVDKFVGDLIMVLFGAPISTGQDARHAVECARAMLAARTQANLDCTHPLEIGIGIATGSVVAGCMGSDQRLSYTVIGHRVNLASRLCHIAKAGEIVMDEQTAARLPQDQPVTPLPAVQLKGISQPVDVFRMG